MKRIYLLTITLSCIAILFNACNEDDSTTPKDHQAMNTCVGCHTNYEGLKSIYTPVPDSLKPTGGCSGEAIFIEPYDRVYFKNYDDYKNNDPHGKLACTQCHGGVDNTVDKELAHSTEKGFKKKPSLEPTKVCGNEGCHPTIAKNAENSIHQQGWGQKRKVTVRYGLTGANDFHMLPAEMKNGYSKNCSTCHGTCGDCHVNTPVANGGGLMNSHRFTKTPDMVKTCVACHVSRGGHAYLGVANGTKPDVHLTKAKFNCLSCHKGSELHGDGTQYETRFHVAELPQCKDCHDITKSNPPNIYHATHGNNLSCYVCHSQPYNNCGSCHIHGEGARIHSYQGFKIGDNPIKNTIANKSAISYDFNKKWSLVRRTLMAPDSWEKYGTPLLTNFDAFPTYNYTAPHNIMKLTPQCTPGVGKQCWDACHIVKEGTTFRNKELYLFESELIESWEKSSSKKVTVDGKLPSSWGL